MKKSEARELEIANFVCKFGDNNLVDYIDTVWSALKNGAFRKFGSTTYYLKDLDLSRVHLKDADYYIISGRLIKQMVLRREQVYRNGKIQRDRASLESAPSAIFALILDNHRLLYLPETSYAPKIEEFGTTLKSIVNAAQRKAKKEYRDAQKAEKIAGVIEDIDDDEVIKRLFPAADIRITPLASSESIASFIERFSVLRRMEITVLETNNEFNWASAYEKIKASGEEIRSQTTEVIYESKDGLSTEVAQKHIHEIANHGNHGIMMKGKDRRGQKLQGNNHEMKMRIPFEISRHLQDDAIRMTAKFNELLKRGAVSIPKMAHNVRGRIHAFFSKSGGASVRPEPGDEA